jgi:hypothetical protein
MTPECLEWSYNPWRERPARALGGCVAAAAFCGVVALLRLPFVMALALSVAAVSPLAVAFLPVRVRLDPGGATRRLGPFAETRPWARVRRAVRRRQGVLLTPFRARSWMDAYAGFFLPVPRQDAPPPADELDRILASHGL